METLKEVFSAKNILLCLGSGAVAGIISFKSGLKVGGKIGYDQGQKDGYQDGFKKGRGDKPMPEGVSVGKLNYV